MAIEQWVAWADVTNPTGSQVGSAVGTQIAAGSSSWLLWYLDKAGIKVGAETPTTGRIYPR